MKLGRLGKIIISTKKYFQMIKISVIVPVYNVENYLKK